MNKELVRLNKVSVNAHGHAYYNYKCYCGNLFIALRNHVACGGIKSCGCFRRLKTSRINYKHGLTSKYPRLFKVWAHMLDRCYKVKNKSYKNYGGRGILVCKRWHSPTSFINWALANGYADDLTIERIDVNKNYCPKNCKFIPLNQQSWNTTVSTGIEKALKIRERAKGGLSCKEIATEFGVNYQTVLSIKNNKTYAA